MRDTKTKCAAICTSKGIRFTPLDPSSEDVSLVDIARGLSNTCRFNGQTRQFYSVAQHSVWVSANVPEEFAQIGLLHDAAEAYLVDMPSPIKPWFGEYAAAADRLTLAIMHRFGISPTQLAAAAESVKAADLRALEIEQWHLMPLVDWWPAPPAPPSDQRFTPLEPARALEQFLARAIDLGMDLL